MNVLLSNLSVIISPVVFENDKRFSFSPEKEICSSVKIRFETSFHRGVIVSVD